MWLRDRHHLPSDRKLVLPALLLAATLAILNPVACLIHCATVQHRHTPPALAFLCAFEHSSPERAPAPQPPLPRAWYEIVPVQMIVASFALIFTRKMQCWGGILATQLHVTPPSPPPKPTL